MLRRTTIVTLSLVAIVALGLGGAWLYGQAARPARAQTPAPGTGYSASQTITVVGQGTAHVQPDVAQIGIGMDTVGDTVSQAVDDNEFQMKAILAALKAQGIADKDIQTSNFSISFESSPQPVPGVGGTTERAKPQYRVSNTVSVKVRNLTKVSDVLDAVIKAGANNIWGVTFTVDDPKVAQAEARTQAMADAQARAQALAELGKVKLGPIMSISETVSGGVMPIYSVAERAMGGGPSISPGEVEVSYQVQVSYYLVQ